MAEGADPDLNGTPPDDAMMDGASEDSTDGNINGHEESVGALDVSDTELYNGTARLNGGSDLSNYDERTQAYGDMGDEIYNDTAIRYSLDHDVTPPPAYANGDLAGTLPRDHEWDYGSTDGHSVNPEIVEDGAYSGSDDDRSFDGDGMHGEKDPLYEDAWMDEDEVVEATEMSPLASRSKRGDGPYYVSTASASGDNTAQTLNDGPVDALAEALARAVAAQKAAQAHWSTREDLGFRHDAPGWKQRDVSVTDLEGSIEVQGAPMANPFFVPGSDILEGIALDPDLGGLEGLGGLVRSQSEGRVGGRGTGRRGRGGIRWALIGTSHDPAIRRAEARAENKRGRGRSRSRRGGARGRPKGRVTVDPGEDFKRHQTEAMSAYMDGDLETAIAWAQLAVQANPEVGIAHWLISEALKQKGYERDSIGALLTGAAIDRDPQMWLEAAERTVQLAEVAEGRLRLAFVNQAMWCYSSAFNHLPRDGGTLDVMARAGIRDVSLELGDVNQARLYSKSVTRLRVTDFANIRIYAELCAATRDHGEINRVRQAYENAFEATSKEHHHLGEVPDAWSHVNIYLELLDTIHLNSEGLKMLKRLARWVLGRKDEDFWDRFVDDDREFDSANDRRALVGEFQQGRASRDRMQYGDGLPLELHVRLGLFRSKMGMRHHEEAMKHFDHALAAEGGTEEYFDVFYSIADSLRLSRMHEGALKFYEALRSVVDSGSESFALNLAECYESLQRDGDAEDTYRALIRSDPKNVHGRVKLARLYERTHCKDEAKALVSEVMGLGHKDSIPQRLLPPRPGKTAGRKGAEKQLLPNPSPASHSPTPRIVPTIEPIESRPPIAPSGEMLSVCKRLEQLWPAVEGRDNAKAIDEWIHLAATALDVFKHEKAFFPGHMRRFNGYASSYHIGRQSEHIQLAQSEREAFAMLNRLEPGVQHPKPAGPSAQVVRSEIPGDYFGIRFSKWHRMFATLALLYADRGDQVHCYYVLREVLISANVFYYDEVLPKTGQAVALHCALKFNDSDYALGIAREFTAHSDFRASMPYQLIAGVARHCHGVENGFYSHASKIFMARAVKIMDYGVMSPDLRSRVNFGQFAPSLEARLAKYGQETGVPDAGVLSMFGNMMAISSYQTAALPYYLRALALQPDSYTINLSIGLTYIHQAMKRQTDNRQHGIQQGLSFVQRYYNLRIASGRASHIQEAEFNKAKTWHMLGLTHLAIAGYEKVLAMSEQVRAEAAPAPEGEVEDFAKEAAYALQQIFALAGNDEAARAITEQWLVL